MKQLYIRRYSWILAVAMILLWQVPTGQASTALVVTTDGCFNRTTNAESNTYRIRMQTPSCTITIQHNGTSSETPIFVLENIDPDFVTVDHYDTDTGLSKTTNTLQFSNSIDPGETETISVEPWHDYGDDFYFVALSDNQAQGTVDVNPVFESIIQQLNVVNPVFYTNSGDLVQGSSSRDTMELMYDSVLEALESSNAPMYPIAGNHDYGPGLDVFTEYFGVDDYTFDFANTRFTGVSTVGSSSRGDVDESTFSWLDSILAANEQQHSIVFFHHPLVRPDWSANEYCCFVSTEDRDELAGIIDTHNTDITINGHSHGYDYRLLSNSDVSTITNGFYQLITGGAGGSIAQPDGKHHFVIVHVTPDGIEHTVVYKSEFDTSIEYTNNSPSNTTATATVLNEDDADLPYARLKFTLSNAFDRYVVYDSEGNYVDNVYYKQLEEYTVVYAEIAPDANSAVTYTAQPATQIHTGITNTVSSTGLVTYDYYPDRIDNVVPLTVVPNAGHTNITNVQWSDEANDYQHSWLETPSHKKRNTTYTLSELPSNRLFEITVNGEIYDRVGTNNNGELEFTYTPTKASRQFALRMLDTLYSDTVATVPYSNGNPQVRRFNSEGSNLTNWFALNAAHGGSYTSVLADVTGDREHEVVVSTGQDTGGTVAVYTKDGDKLAQTKPFGDDYQGGITLYHGDLTGDGKEDIVCVSNTGVSTIALYRYNTTTEKLKLLSTIKPFGKQYYGGVNVALGNLNSTTADEMAVVATDSTKSKFSVYKVTNKKRFHKLRTKTIPNAYAHASIAIGELTRNDVDQIALYLTDSNGVVDHVSLYRLKDTRTVSLISSEDVNSSVAGPVTVTLADIDGNFSDDIILYSHISPVIEVFKVKSDNSIIHRFTRYPFGKNYQAGLDVSILDADNNWDVEIITSQLAEDSRVKLWNYRSKSKTLHTTVGWRGYGTDFSGGTRLAK